MIRTRERRLILMGSEARHCSTLMNSDDGDLDMQVDYRRFWPAASNTTVFAPTLLHVAKAIIIGQLPIFSNSIRKCRKPDCKKAFKIGQLPLDNPRGVWIKLELEGREATLTS
jgi:hypothetical protein